MKESESVEDGAVMMRATEGMRLASPSTENIDRAGAAQGIRIRRDALRHGLLMIVVSAWSS